MPTEKPVFDYPNWPFSPRSGNRHESNRVPATRALFMETCGDDYSMVKYTLSEDTKWCEQRQEWMPSAWLIYIHASDEYDAIRKISGSIKCWEAIKKMTLPWSGKFIDMLEEWEAEQAYLQRSNLKAELLAGIRAGTPGYTSAAKIVLQIIDGKNPVGRPKRAKATADVPESADIEDDASRIIDFAKAKHKKESS